jgi:hypothetical protein
VVDLTRGEDSRASALPARRVEMTPGQSYGRKAGVEHDVINAGDAPVSFVEIELKRRPG